MKKLDESGRRCPKPCRQLISSGRWVDIETAQTKHARAPDGAYIAYQTVGDGPIDIVWQSIA
jgi:hypothetical protein